MILKPWYAVAIPYKDIREGCLAEAGFAADLWVVMRGTAPEVDLDPEEFFRVSVRGNPPSGLKFFGS